MKSVMELFAPPGSQVRKNQDKPLHIGAAKANVGHGEAAAGITSLAKVLLMMRNNAIPPRKTQSLS